MKSRFFPCPRILSGWRAFVISLVSLAASHSASAATLTWDTVSGDGSTITAGSGVWNASNTNWNSGSTNVAWTDGSDAVFQGGGTHTVTQSGTATAATISLGSGATGYTLANASGDSLSVTGTFTNNWGMNLNIGGTLGVAGTYSAAYNATRSINGGGTLNITTFSVKNLSTVNFSGSTTTANVSGNFYLGDATSQYGVFNQSAGTVNLTSATANSIRIGHWSNTATVSKYNLSGGTLNTNTVVNTAWDGSGEFNVSGGVANVKGIGVTNGTRVGNGTFSLTGGRVNIGSSGITAGTGAGTKTVNLGAGTLGATANWSSSVAMTLTDSTTGTTVNTLDSADNTTARTITLSGVLSGSGAINKAGAGTLTVSGANSYAGGTTLQSGTLAAGNATAFGTGAVTVNGGTLTTGANTVANNVNVTADAAINGTYSGTVTTGTDAARAINTASNVSIATLSGQGAFSGGTTTVTTDLSLGSAVGTQTHSSLALDSANVTTRVDLAAYAAGGGVGVGYDQIGITGALAFTAPSTLTIDGTSATDYTTAFWDSDHTIELVKYGSVSGTPFTASFNSPFTSADPAQGGWTLVDSGSSYNAVWTAVVPEPSAILLGGLGALALLRRKRD